MEFASLPGLDTRRLEDRDPLRIAGRVCELVNPISNTVGLQKMAGSRA
jgi:hypothetical protein